MKNKDVELFTQTVLKDAVADIDDGLRKQYQDLPEDERDILNRILRLQAIRLLDIISDAAEYLDADIDTIRFEHESARLVRLYAKNPKHYITDTGEEVGGPPEMFIGQCEHWFEDVQSDDTEGKLSKVGIRTISFRPSAKKKEDTRYYIL